MMRHFIVLLLFSLTGCVAAYGPGPGAPQPVKPIDIPTFFSGRWYEMARTPISLTHDCMAGTTDFYTKPDGTLIERDACHKGSPTGPEKVFAGPVHFINPGVNNEFTVRYTLFYVLPVTATYWVLDRAEDYSWFIVSTPSMGNVAFLDRDPNPPQAVIDALTARTKALGYDVSKLEYPPRGN